MMTKHVTTNIAGVSDVGQIRQVNEDSVLINQDLQLYAIADGMGGHGSGDVASQLAIKTLQNCIAADGVHNALTNKSISNAQAQALLYQCIIGVNQRIFQENARNGHTDGNGMGTTLVGFCLIGGSDDGNNDNSAHRAISFNVGDSRLYEYRKENLAQLTTDHTMYRNWEVTGRIGPAPSRNIIMRAIGLFDDVEVDMDVLSIEPDATYLLCSDGLNGMVTDEHIATILDQPDDAHTISNALVQSANDNGGTDNISVITLAPTQSN